MNLPFELAPEQQAAKEKFIIWWESCLEAREKNKPAPEPFRLFGYAGTGKTTIAKNVIGDLRMSTKQPDPDNDAFVEARARVLYGSYTGKSCLVMTRNGMPAKTIHSRIYKMVPPSKEGAEKIKKEMDSTIDERKKIELLREYKESLKMHFELNEESDLKDADLYTIDEVSFVNKEMRNDIQFFNVPLFVLGDPGQLPPIEGTGAFIDGKPDAMLTEIHRQALDNPIIMFSLKARMGIPLQRGDFGKVKILDKRNADVSSLLAADQILAGKNDTRRNVNNVYRRAKGIDPITDPYPLVGEKLICLKNSKKHGIFNGQIVHVTKRLDDFDTYIEYEVQLENEERKLIIRAHRAYFQEYLKPGTIKELKWWDFQDTEEFDFGYCITVHKSQGSQYGKVILVDDNFFIWDKPMRKKWLYTGITRAADELTVLQ